MIDFDQDANISCGYVENHAYTAKATKGSVTNYIQKQTQWQHFNGWHDTYCILFCDMKHNHNVAIVHNIPKPIQCLAGMSKVYCSWMAVYISTTYKHFYNEIMN